VVIARRFNGPPGSGHGGWSAGQVGLLLDEPVAEVTLRRPPPLETPLIVQRRDGTAALLDGDAVVAIQAWLERADGRKRHTAAALYTADGERRAAGRAVCVQLAPPLGS
jgi:hypothetical protein